MPSSNLSTASHGDAQRQGKVLVAAGATSNIPGLWKLQTRNSSGTLVTYNVWISSDGRLRYSTTEPTNQLTDGTDITSTVPAGSVLVSEIEAVASGRILVGNAGGTALAAVALSGDATLASTGALTIAASAVETSMINDAAATPLKSSTAMQEMPITYRVEDLAAGGDIAARTIFRTTSTMSLSRGLAFISFRDAVSVGSGDTISVGLGTTAANDVFGRSWTSTISAGTYTSIAVGSVSAISTSTNVRLDVTQSTGVNAGNFDIVWIPQKRGSN